MTDSLHYAIQGKCVNKRFIELLETPIVHDNRPVNEIIDEVVDKAGLTVKENNYDTNGIDD